jgi:ElaB/YqjD/DUF883 family membrane-anchored ribosome-binding protein
MSIQTLYAILGALASLAAGGFVSSGIIRKLLVRVFSKPEPQKTYSERLSELTSSLTTASAEVDSLLNELSKVAKEKETSVKQLENGLTLLEQKERALKDNIHTLENIPIPVAEHFAKIVESGERRSAARDYVLFGAGVLVTTVITIAIQLATG